MTHEDKELLLKDLCARLPYGTKAQDYDDEPLFTIVGYECLYFCDDNGWEYKVDEIKPYLFPLSSMTEEQKKEEYEICKEYIIGYESNLIDFYNRNHIDYRGLIPKGLALDATGLNIY